ncbi:MAG TPA: ABC transporter permease [Cyclobacteriaceae bacterium]|nr:ABC transporter permease [Cyclobacteriaceae bacterium]
MIRNYFQVAIRNIRQNSLYAFINIFSLSIGLAACLVIYLFIADESGFDSFHSQSASIYRLDEVQNFSGTHEQKVALSMPGMGPSLVTDFPEVVGYARFFGNKRLVKKDDRQFLLKNVASVDSTFLDFFDFAWKAGDRNTALDKPYSLVLTETTARKFFDDPSTAVGSSLKMLDKEYMITGLLYDVPENAHLQFDALASMTTITQEQKDFNDRWGSNFLVTYIRLAPDADIKSLEAKFPDYLIKHTGEQDINQYYKLFLQPLNQVHLGSTDIEHDYHNYRKFNGAYLRIFAIVGGLILLIAAVNFMNLTTARASHRWKEIGVRSSIGAGKGQLFGQFVFESVLLALGALLLGVLADLLLLPGLNLLIGRQLSLLALANHPLELLVLLAATILLGMLAGIYPSLYMTSFQPSSVLKGNKKEGRSLFRSSLVVIQFGLALAMIVSTIIVVRQLSYMQQSEMGFDKDHILLIDMNQEVNQKYATLKEELLKSPHVRGVTASGQRLGNNFHQWGYKVRTDTGVVNITPSNVNVDYDYLTVYGIQIKAGRNFNKDNARDKDFAFIINETFARELNAPNVLGMGVGHGWYKDDSLGSIIGVAQDFHFNSMHHKINTLSMVVHPDWGYSEMSVKVDGSDPAAAIDEVQDIWKRTVSYPFDYTFLDQHFDNLYQSDRQMSSVVTIMAVLAILLSCLGLFGLVTITVQKRVKEVGIRKALGASEQEITTLLSRNYIGLIVIAFVLASPVTYWVLNRWLDGFAYHIGIHPGWFFAGAALTLAIAGLTIAYHTMRAARENPVKALRYE